MKILFPWESFEDKAKSQFTAESKQRISETSLAIALKYTIHIIQFFSGLSHIEDTQSKIYNGFEF